MVGVDRQAAPLGEHRQAQRSHHMAGPVSAGESRVGRIEPTHLHAQRRLIAEKDPVADGAMDGVVGKAIGRRFLEVEPE